MQIQGRGYGYIASTRFEHQRMTDGNLVNDKQKLLPAASLIEEDAYRKNGVEKSRTFTIPVSYDSILSPLPQIQSLKYG